MCVCFQNPAERDTRTNCGCALWDQIDKNVQGGFQALTQRGQNFQQRQRSKVLQKKKVVFKSYDIYFLDFRLIITFPKNGQTFFHRVSGFENTSELAAVEVRPIRLIRQYQILIPADVSCIIFSHIFIIDAQLIRRMKKTATYYTVNTLAKQYDAFIM